MAQLIAPSTTASSHTEAPPTPAPAGPRLNDRALTPDDARRAQPLSRDPAHMGHRERLALACAPHGRVSHVNTAIRKDFRLLCGRSSYLPEVRLAYSWQMLRLNEVTSACARGGDKCHPKGATPVVAPSLQCRYDSLVARNDRRDVLASRLAPRWFRPTMLSLDALVCGPILVSEFLLERPSSSSFEKNA